MREDDATNRVQWMYGGIPLRVSRCAIKFALHEGRWASATGFPFTRHRAEAEATSRARSGCGGCGGRIPVQALAHATQLQPARHSGSWPQQPTPPCRQTCASCHGGLGWQGEHRGGFCERQQQRRCGRRGRRLTRSSATSMRWRCSWAGLRVAVFSRWPPRHKRLPRPQRWKSWK